MVKLTQEPRVLGEVGKRQCPAPELDTSEGVSRGSGLLVGEAKGRPGQGFPTQNGAGGRAPLLLYWGWVAKTELQVTLRKADKKTNGLQTCLELLEVSEVLLLMIRVSS